jgi:hypothetical protein
MNVEASAPSRTEQSVSSRSDGGAPQKGAPLFVVVGRVLLLLAAAAALGTGIVRARTHDRAVATTLGRYVCPMHPEVVSAAPGDCPICNMALVPEPTAPAPMAGADEVTALVERRFVSERIRTAACVGTDGEGTAVLHNDDLVGLSAREPALYFGGASPNMPVHAHLVLESPAPIDGSTVRVRFALDEPLERPGAAAGRPDVGSLQIAPRARELVVVPRSAVLYSAQGPYVLAAAQPGDAFAKRSIQIGRILDSGYVGALDGTEQGAIVVLAGLHEGERVVAGYTFFVDAERRLREARAAGVASSTSGTASLNKETHP